MIIYQVLPRLWGRGRFSDWQAPAFDYLKSLGVDAIWFTGIPRHSSGQAFVKGTLGSPYSISDYHDVNPYLADDGERRMEEFGALVGRVHQAGFRFIMDFVPNHVAPGCMDVPTLDRYDFDWDDTRKIDYSAPGAWESMLDIALFWASKGVDGLRCDMVELVPRDFLRWLVSKVRERYPAFIFIGEVYEKSGYRSYIRDIGFDLLYDKSGYYDKIRAVISGQESARALTWNWQSLGDIQGNMLNFLENHDEQRLASPYFAGDPSKAYAALAYGALFNDASFMLYSGQELGEDASEGAEGRTSIFDMVKVRTIGDLCSKLEGKRQRLPLAESRVLARYRDILRYVPRFSGMSNWDLCYCNEDSAGFIPDRHTAFVRYRAGSAWLVFCNFSSLPSEAVLSIPAELKEKCHPAILQDGNVKVAAKAFDATILRLSRR